MAGLLDYVPFVGAALGALGGSNPGQSTQSQKVTLDPRMDAAVYGSGGIVPTMSNWYAANNNGMNAQMLQGLNQQYQTLNDPFTQAGYNRTGMNGYNLMGGSVAGNPFATGQASLQGGFGGSGPMSLAPQAANSVGWGQFGGSGGGPFKMPSLLSAAEQKPLQSYIDQLAAKSGGMAAGATGAAGGYGGTLPFDTGSLAAILGNLGFTSASNYLASQNDGYSPLSGNAGYSDPRDAAAYGYGVGNTAPQGQTAVGQLAQQYGMYNNPNAGSSYSPSPSYGGLGSMQSSTPTQAQMAAFGAAMAAAGYGGGDSGYGGGGDGGGGDGGST